jgi:hypothetical protein
MERFFYSEKSIVYSEIRKKIETAFMKITFREFQVFNILIYLCL